MEELADAFEFQWCRMILTVWHMLILDTYNLALKKLPKTI